MQKFSFGLTDLTSFDRPAGEFVLDLECVAGQGRDLAVEIARTMPDVMIAGLCIVAFDAAGDLVAVVPLATVH